MFRNLLLSALLAFAAVPAFAQETPNPCADLANATKGLSAQATATLLDSCREKGNGIPAVVKEMADPEQANQWADAAKGIAQAIGIAAKELGIAANDFLDSPAGFVVALLLLLNYGGSVIGMFFAVPLTFLLTYVFYKMISKVWVDKAEYEFVPVLWGMFSIRRVKSVVHNEAAEGTGFMTAVYLFAYGVGCAILWVNFT